MTKSFCLFLFLLHMKNKLNHNQKSLTYLKNIEI